MLELEKTSRRPTRNRLAPRLAGLLAGLLLGCARVALAVDPIVGNTNANWIFQATNHLGAMDLGHQTPSTSRPAASGKPLPSRGAKITSAILDITVDNGYTLFLDGRENWARQRLANGDGI